MNNALREFLFLNYVYSIITPNNRSSTIGKYLISKRRKK